MKNWLGYVMLNSHFLFTLKILSILHEQGIIHVSIFDLNSLRESTLFFRWYANARILHDTLHAFNKNVKSYPTSIDVSDQPVYALTKELQYRYLHPSEKYCPIMGGLHIEQSLLRICGQLIEGSGLVEILTLQNF